MGLSFAFRRWRNGCSPLAVQRDFFFDLAGIFPDLLKRFEEDETLSFGLYKGAINLVDLLLGVPDLIARRVRIPFMN